MGSWGRYWSCVSAAADMVAPSLPGAGLLNSKVLVLNRSYLPVHVTSVKRAFALLYQGVAKAVDEQYHTFDFESWADLSIEVQHERLGLVNGFIRVPRVLLLTAYERVPKRHVRFSRFNIFARDGNTCQSCHKKLPRTELNLDHVIPRSRGGMSTWENIVCSCHHCNRRKGVIERVSISDILYYAGGTGLLATALTSLKFREVDLTAAIFFSVIGPFVLKNMILGQLQQEIRSNTTTAVKERKDRSVRKATGKQGLNRAKQDLKAKGLSETTQGTEAADERPQ